MRGDGGADPDAGGNVGPWMAVGGSDIIHPDNVLVQRQFRIAGRTPEIRLERDGLRVRLIMAAASIMFLPERAFIPIVLPEPFRRPQTNAVHFPRCAALSKAGRLEIFFYLFPGLILSRVVSGFAIVVPLAKIDGNRGGQSRKDPPHPEPEEFGIVVNLLLG